MAHSESTKPLSVATDPSAPSANSHLLCKSTQAHSSKVLTIAISGCSSSGKTLLSLLLEAVFTGLNFTVSRLTNCQSFLSPIIIHGDNYFVSKDNCPLVTFESTKADSNFILKSIRHDTGGLYYIHDQSETTALDDASLRHISLEEPLIRTVTGPDTDCWEAIDVPALIKAIKDIKMSRASIEYHQEHIGLENSNIDMARWTEPIQEMQQFVKKWLVKEDIFTDFEINSVNLPTTKDIRDNPNTADSEYAHEEHDTDLTSHRTPSVPLQDVCNANCQVVNSSMSQPPDSIDDVSPNILREYKPSCVQKNELMSLFDMKLFLPTSRDVAKARRFSRRPYMDCPNGGRKEGQYWKTEGYFDDVAWPNYEKFHRWLLAGEELNHVSYPDGETVSTEIGIKSWQRGDVHLREVDAGVENTLRWAVGMILAEMSRQRYKFEGQKEKE